MPQCSFNRPAAMMQATPVQNMFLIEYMPKAPDAYVKVYLYGLMQCCNPTLAQDSLEEALGMDAQAVAEAFVYWQAQGLVSILAQDPLRVEYRHPGAPATLSQGGAGRYAAFNQALQQALRESLGESGKARVFFPGEMQRIYDWMEVFGLEEEAAILLIQHCLREKGPRASVLENARLAGGMEEYSRRQAALEDLAANAFRRAGIQRRATAAQRMQLETWLYAWHMSPEVILLAAEYAAGDSRPFSAMERRVRRWHEGGVRTVAAAQADHAQESVPSGAQAAKSPVSRALRPPQRTYTAEDLKHIGVNLLDDEDE